MACGCMKNKIKAYVYVGVDGTETEKPTEVEAKAMMIRAGNVGAVKAKTDSGFSVLSCSDGFC